MVEFRRKEKIGSQVPMGGLTPFQMYLFRSDILGSWRRPIDIIVKTKFYRGENGKIKNQGNLRVMQALNILVGLGLVERRE